MTTARKSSPRKTAPRKAAPRPPVEESPEEVNADLFEEYRARAHNAGLEQRDPTEPYLIPGFTPPVAIAYPDARKRRLLRRAQRAKDFYLVVEILLESDFDRVADKFEQFEDSDLLLSGLALRALDHFAGKGAADLPGGTPAS